MYCENRLRRSELDIRRLQSKCYRDLTILLNHLLLSLICNLFGSFFRFLRFCHSSSSSSLKLFNVALDLIIIVIKKHCGSGGTVVRKQCFEEILFGAVSMYERKVSMVVIDIFAKGRVNFFSMRSLSLICLRFLVFIFSFLLFFCCLYCEDLFSASSEDFFAFFVSCSAVFFRFLRFFDTFFVTFSESLFNRFIGCSFCYLSSLSLHLAQLISLLSLQIAQLQQILDHNFVCVTPSSHVDISFEQLCNRGHCHTLSQRNFFV